MLLRRTVSFAFRRKYAEGRLGIQSSVLLYIHKHDTSCLFELCEQTHEADLSNVQTEELAFSFCLSTARKLFSLRILLPHQLISYLWRKCRKEEVKQLAREEIILLNFEALEIPSMPVHLQKAVTPQCHSPHHLEH